MNSILVVKKSAQDLKLMREKEEQKEKRIQVLPKHINLPHIASDPMITPVSLVNENNRSIGHADREV